MPAWKAGLVSPYTEFLKNKFTISIVVLTLSLVFSRVTFAQDVHSLFTEAQRLEDNRKEAEALRKYLDVIKMQPAHLPALCKVSELYNIIGSRQRDKQSRLTYYKMAKKYAETALKINPRYSDANFVMAIAMGRMALILGGQDKITAVNDIKKYAEIAAITDPANYKAFHVLGKWHYEVSSLNAFERMGVKMLFGGFPPSSYHESIRNYEKSRTLNPGFALNYLEVAKVYNKSGQDKKALEILKKLQSLPVKSSEDPRIRKDAEQLIKKLRG